MLCVSVLVECMSVFSKYLFDVCLQNVKFVCICVSVFAPYMFVCVCVCRMYVLWRLPEWGGCGEAHLLNMRWHVYVRVLQVVCVCVCSSVHVFL